MNERLLWHPSKAIADNANISHYSNWLMLNKNLSFDHYDALWQWSIENTSDFWESIWQYFDILHDGQYTQVLHGDLPYRASWFEGTSLNYAEHIFRQETLDRPAIIYKKEGNAVAEMSWAALRQKTASLQDHLRMAGVSTGDCVAGYLPCTPEATVSMLATVGLGAMWTSCSPDFGTAAVIDRFAQMNPKVLIATDAYTYGGKSFDKRAVIKELIDLVEDHSL